MNITQHIFPHIVTELLWGYSELSIILKSQHCILQYRIDHYVFSVYCVSVSKSTNKVENSSKITSPTTHLRTSRN